MTEDDLKSLNATFIDPIKFATLVAESRSGPRGKVIRVGKSNCERELDRAELGPRE